MIGPVQIKNFKSIRDLGFDAKRVNVFIGEPNTGKSNIIEGLALLSGGRLDDKLFRELFRFRTVADLFLDQQVSAKIEVRAGDRLCSFQFERGRFLFTYNAQGRVIGKVEMDQQAQYSNWVSAPEGVRFYRFKEIAHFNRHEYGVLMPPFGENLASIIYTNKDLRRRVSDLFRTRGFRLEIKPVEMELMLAKAIDDELYSFPYGSISETWRRIVFYMAVLETNQNATLLLDEPEANTFPFYTKYLAERIALDATNQFFMTTHIPYLLSSVVEKTPVKDLAVFVTRMEKFETRLKQIPDKNLPELLELDADAFFNLDRLAEG
jgi:predicted ATPase